MWSQRGSPAGTHSTLSSPPASSVIWNIADRPGLDDAAREHRLGQQHHRVQRVAVLAEGVLDEAVVGRVAHRGVQVAVQLHPPGVVVHLVLVARTLRDLDDDVELHRRGSLPMCSGLEGRAHPNGAIRCCKDGGQQSRRVMRPTRWRRSTHVVIGVAVLLLVAAVVGAAAVLTTGNSTSDAEAIKPAPPAATAEPGIVPVADSATKPTPDRLAATLAPLVADPNLGALTGQDHRRDHRRAAVGAGRRRADAAGVDEQGAHHRRRAAGPRPRRPADHPGDGQPGSPGVVVLKGGGDPTLSAAPAGQDTWYKGAARISDLADQVRRSGTDVTTVQVDVSAYSGPTMAPGWDPADIDGGDIAPMEAVMLDGGRTQPVSVESRRSTTPALDAGRALAVALKVDPATVTVLPTGAARRPGDRIGAIAAADRAAAANDERVRQRDGRVDRPRGRRRAEPAAEFRRRRAGGAQPARQGARSTPAVRGCSTPAGCPSTTG